MSEEENAGPRFSKGDQLAIVRGKANVGVRGEIFWSGANKYGPGFRYGLKDEGGETYWVDEADLGPVDGAPAPPPPKPSGPAKDPIAKGATVEITGGREGVGETGEIFWVGDSKFGKGLRYGVKNADGTTFWVDEAFVNQIDAPAPSAKAAKPGADANEFRDDSPAPPPFDDEPPLEDDDERYDADDFGDEFGDEDLPF